MPITIAIRFSAISACFVKDTMNLVNRGAKRSGRTSSAQSSTGAQTAATKATLRPAPERHNKKPIHVVTVRPGPKSAGFGEQIGRASERYRMEIRMAFNKAQNHRLVFVELKRA